MDFKKEDVIKVAEAIAEDPLYFDNSDTRDYGYWCSFCGNGDKGGYSLEKQEPDKIVHKLDCVVLIARDLLTGAR